MNESILTLLRSAPVYKLSSIARLLLPNLVFSLLSLAVVILIDILVKTIGLDRFALVNSYPVSYLILFLVFMLVSFIQNKRVFFFSMVIVSVLILFEAIYMQYFGRFIPQQQINDLFYEYDEIYPVITVQTRLVMLALIPAILNLILFVSISRMTSNRIGFPHAGTTLVLLFLCFSLWVYNYQDKVNVAPQPIFLNTYLSMVHTSTMYLTHELPRTFSLVENITEPYVADTPKILQHHHSKPVNIVFIMGESLGSDHMSVYGYSRQTTPFLEKISSRRDVVIKKGIAASAKTSISVPHIVNMIKKPDGMQQILSDRTNLFRLARENNMITHYVTATNIHFLKSFINYMGVRYIDRFIDLNPDREVDNLMDEVVVDYLENVDFSRSNFVMLHMRGSHTPYRKRYTEAFARYPVDRDLPFRQKEINAYDNSVLYTDYVIKKTFRFLKNATKNPAYLVFTSDHGESLGENGIWGHLNNRIPTVIRVPAVIIAVNNADLSFVDEMVNTAVNREIINQFELSKLVSRMMGYDTPVSSVQGEGYYVNGERLDGSSGFLRLVVNKNHELIDPASGNQYISGHQLANGSINDDFLFQVRVENTHDTR
ncbi:MAG TPA: phosphoethanolamine transferase [Gammaproteobacteria bacterium]|nr:phosphoethanolamine transferase [Gammaproteobacteria bacterium]